MIYPTRRAVIAAGAGAPFALAIAAVAPGLWPLGLTWTLAVVLLSAIDAVRGMTTARAQVDMPDSACVGETRDCIVTVAFDGRAPAEVEVALDRPPQVEADNDGRLLVPIENGAGAAALPLTMKRRGIARFEQLWLRWTGPLGLAWHQGSVPITVALPVVPDVRPVHTQGARLLERQAVQGLVAQFDRGEGSDFDSLVEYRPGMDRRAVDWKQSARHSKLLAKFYRSERNSQIIFVVDSGRQMSEPVAGLPRVDRMVSAVLLTGWLALKMGDRVGLHAFDSRPRLASGIVSGSAAFGELKRIAAEIDYSQDETNYSFALTTLAARLSRRSMIILFTEFTDSTSAQFLMRAVRRLLETHLLLVVLLRDEELEQIAGRQPREPDDVARAITAAGLLKQRRTMITQLQHLGAHIIESEHDRVPERLVAGYLDLKRRNLL